MAKITLKEPAQVDHFFNPNKYYAKSIAEMPRDSYLGGIISLAGSLNFKCLIYKDLWDTIFLLQDVRQGAMVSNGDLKGYKYSYTIERGTGYDLAKYGVHIATLYNVPQTNFNKHSEAVEQINVDVDTFYDFEEGDTITLNGEDGTIELQCENNVVVSFQNQKSLGLKNKKELFDAGWRIKLK